jgi:hypothetical protein
MSQGFVNPQTITLPLPVSDGGTGATSATAYAVQCGGTTSTGAHQSIASVGTSGQVLTSNGAGALPTFQAASVSPVTVSATGSGGSSIQFSSIPSTAKIIHVNFMGLACSTTGDLWLRLGTSGGQITSGYVSSCWSGITANLVNGSTNTAYFVLIQSNTFGAGAAAVGTITLTLSNSGNNTWVIGGGVNQGSLAAGASPGGYLTCTNALTDIYIGQSGGGTFNAGSANITYFG